jgi:pyrroloquinoline quinone biosynthesis protein D
MTEDPPPGDRPRRTVIGATSRPRLPRHIRLRKDSARGTWTMLAPERVFTPDEIAAAVLQLCDGSRTVEDMVLELSASYNASRDRMLADIVSMLQELADKGVVVA